MCVRAAWQIFNIRERERGRERGGERGGREREGRRERGGGREREREREREEEERERQRQRERWVAGGKGGGGMERRETEGGIPRYVVRIEKIYDSVEYKGIEKEEEDRRESER